MIYRRPVYGRAPCIGETPWRKGIPRLNSGAATGLVALRIQRARTRGARADVRTRREASPRRLSPRHLLQEARGPSATRDRSGSSASSGRAPRRSRASVGRRRHHRNGLRRLRLAAACRHRLPPYEEKRPTGTPSPGTASAEGRWALTLNGRWVEGG